MTTHRATAVVKALAAAVLLIALLVGVPYVLLIAAGNPLPDPLPTLDDLTRPDPTGRLFLSAVALLGWAGWASFAIAVAAEIPAQIRRVPAPRLPGLAPQQRAAGVLLAIIAAGVVVPSASATTAATAAGPTSAPTAAVQVLTEQSPGAIEEAPATAQDTATAGDPAGTATAAQSTPEAPTVQVAPGDNLWDLAAEHLGAGERWREIAALNYDVVQADGTSLGADHTLRPAWTLTLPAPPAAAVDDQGTATRVVEPGDTLWDIAEQDLGDGQRYDEIAAATTSTVQPDGQQLSDPDLIQPGWQVTVPGADTQPEQPTPTAAEQAAAEQAAAEQAAAEQAAAEQAAAEQAAAQEAAAQEDAAQEAAAQEAAAQEAAAQEAAAEQAAASAGSGADEAEEDVLLDQRAAAGAGALVLAGVLIGLAARRRAQQRRRKPGERLPAPSPQAQMTELEVRAAADGQGLADIDHAMRALGAHARATTTDLPQVRAVRLTAEEVQLYLAEAPEDLPAPWAHTESRTVWVLARGDVAQLPLDEGPAPYPSLVTLGRDTQGAQLLLDLEHICTLAVTDDGAGDVLRSLAVELAVSPWADNLTVTVVGFGQDLTQALDSPRLQHAADLEHLIARLTKRAEAVTDLLADADVDDVAQARARGRGRDAHAPEIVLIDQPIPDDVRERLQGLVTALPRVGLAAVTSQDAMGHWQLRLNAAADEEEEGLLAHLEPADLYLRPEQLTEAECASLGALLATTDLAPVAGPSWASNLAEELTLDDLPVHDPADDDQEVDEHDDHGRGQDEQPAPQQGSVQAAAHLTPRHHLDEPAATDQDSGAHADVPGTVAGDLDVDDVDAEPEAATLVDEDVHGDEPQDHDDEPATPAEETRGASVHRLPLPRPTAPYVKVLGDVALTQCAGSPPKEPSKRGVLMALITYLALKPGAADNRVLAEALRPSKPLAASTVDAHASRARHWLGAAPDGEQYLPLKRDGGSYTLHPDVRTDWDDYLELVGQDAAATHTDRLLQALALVEGIPLAAPNAQHYAWAEPLRQEMVSSISDVAHEVARRAQLRGDLATVRTAVAAAHRVDELDEHAWRDLLRAEHNAGHDDTVAAHADRVRTLAENIGVELDDDTEALIEQLTAPHAGARTAVAL